MPMKSREMMRYLELNGFKCVRSNGSHHFYRNFSNGRTTTVPRHSKDLKLGIQKKILKDAGLY